MRGFTVTRDLTLNNFPVPQVLHRSSFCVLLFQDLEKKFFKSPELSEFSVDLKNYGVYKECKVFSHRALSCYRYFSTM